MVLSIMKNMSSGNSNGGLKISTDSITFLTSGVIDQTKNMVMGHLHKQLKPVNQLRMIEDVHCHLQNSKSI